MNPDIDFQRRPRERHHSPSDGYRQVIWDSVSFAVLLAITRFYQGLFSYYIEYYTTDTSTS